MNIREWLFLTLFLICMAAHAVHAGSPVWKVVKGDRRLFIGGTVHVLTPSDYPLPSTFESAYKQSVELVFETNIFKTKAPDFQKALVRKVTYSDGRNLKAVLDRKTYQGLEQHLSSRGIPIAAMVNYKPGMVVMTLTVIELNRLGLSGTGVDEFFCLRAINDQKEIGQLETVEEQMAFIATMGEGWENELVAYTLRDIKTLPEMMQAIKGAWRSGDNSKLKELALKPFKKDFPAAYNKLIVERNKAWVPKIEALLKTRAVEFVLVGALHLVGNDGILAQLEARGYEIQTP